MRLPLGVVRTLESIFLLGVSWGLARAGEDTTMFYTFVVLGFEVSVAPEAAKLSTMIFGYLFALIGTLIQRETVHRKLYIASMVMCILGITSYSLEAIRFFAGYHFRIVVSLPIVLVIIDWVLFSKDRPIEGEITSLPSGS
jgi:hypothetical protein